jgi:hypothetical protein
LGIPLTAYSPLGSPGAKLHFQQKYNFHYLWVDMLFHTIHMLFSSNDKSKLTSESLRQIWDMNLSHVMHFTFCLVQCRMCFLWTYFKHLMANIKDPMTFITIFGGLFHDAGSISDYITYMVG